MRYLPAIFLAGCSFGGGSSPDVPDDHRSEAVLCDGGRETWTVEPADTGGTFTYGDGCTDHTDCTTGDEGRCSSMSGRGGPYLTCTYTECLTDDDCDGVCDCAADTAQAHNTCLPPGDCKVDADCGDEFCSPSVTSCGPGWGLLGHFCHSRDDECRSDSECSGGGYCAFDEAQDFWTCMEGTCVG